MRTPLRAALLPLLLVLTLGWSTLPVGAAPPVEGPAAPEQAPAAEPPVLVSPLDEALTTGASDSYPPLGVPTLMWSSAPGAARYHVQVSPSAGFATLLIDQDTYATAFSPSTVLADGTYYWRVKAQVGTTWGAYSAAWFFEKNWSARGSIVPALISPPEGAERASFAADDFSWTPVPGAATYRFEISPDDTFSTITYDEITVKPHHTPTVRLANNTYYWRVTPVDRRGNLGAASEVRSFQFKWELAPALLTPEDNVDVQFLPRFSWTAVEAARDYRLEISTQPDFSTSLTPYATDQTDYTPALNLANDQDYYWRVRATDYGGINGPWSAVRHFRMRWNFAARLLTPLNNLTSLSYPFFSWAPIPGAERYQIQIDDSTGFGSPVANTQVYNVGAYTEPSFINKVLPDTDYYWRVRALDGQNNLTPWSDLWSFRPVNTTRPSIRPSQVYPPYYYPPDTVNTPVYSDRTIAWPLFVWDTAHVFDFTDNKPTLRPDYYELMVDDDPAFHSPNFQVLTAGLAAAPTASHQFAPPLEDGRLYYWQVRAYHGGSQIGVDSVWVTRYDSQVRQLPRAETITPIYPADGFEAVGTPPVLGWQPVTGTLSYEVQVSRDRAFTQVVDEAETATVDFVPWQEKLTEMPFDAYWWRVRTKNPAGAWSEPRRFNLSVDLLTGNPYDFMPPARPSSLLTTTLAYDPALTFIAAGAGAAGTYGLGALHVIVDRTYTGNYAWAIAFGTGASGADALSYGLYFDIDHVEGAGATGDPRGKPVSVDPLYLPEFALYIDRASGNTLDPANAFLYRWNGSGWDPPQTLWAIGGDVWLDAATNAVQVLVPYTAIGSEDPKAAGSLALTVFSTSTGGADGARASIPAQGATLNHPALVSDMLMPLYPFNTPFSDPIVFNDMPALRWRMPYFDSVDGYQVEVARDARFTDIVETWESYEIVTWPYYALIPAAFQSKNAYEDNASYYWRVRIRHERYTPDSTKFDYGPWSPAMRFRLDSRLVGHPGLSTGPIAAMTPTFTWDRVEGASGYKLQLDNDSNFSSPLNWNLDGTSFTPTSALADGAYYWRVAMRRSSAVIGQWTPTMSFVKQSVSPAALSPAYDDKTAQQPTFTWAVVLTPTVEPRLAAPRYRLQVASDPNFSGPRTYNTTATSYTPAKGQSLADGTWYWRLALLDANGNPGTFGPTQRFYKEYRKPTLAAPPQGSSTTGIPTFKWDPLGGAAYYRIQIANNELFNSPIIDTTTDSTRYTPISKLPVANYYWRVRIYDADGNPGRYEESRVHIGNTVYLPLVVR